MSGEYAYTEDDALEELISTTASTESDTGIRVQTSNTSNTTERIGLLLANGFVEKRNRELRREVLSDVDGRQYLYWMLDVVETAKAERMDRFERGLFERHYVRHWTYKMIRELQPKCLIWNDGSDRGDLRWVGTEAGNVGETNWSLLNHDGEVPYEMLHYGVEDGDVWCPGETNTSIRPGWFYHETENEHVKSLSKLMDTYYKSVGRNSTLLLNFPIAPNGRIHPNDSLRGIAFKKMIDEVFKENLAEQAEIIREGNTTIIDFGKPTAFNRFLAEEAIAKGQRVKKFSLEALVGGKWQQLKDALVDKGDGLTTKIGRASCRERV